MSSILQPLNKGHNRKLFDCGNAAINSYLQQQAGQADRKNISRTSVVTSDDNPIRILGFVTVLPVSIEPPDSIVKSHQLVPALKIARLGVDKDFQNKGFAGLIIMEVLKIFYHTLQEIPMVGICVEAKDEAIGFYQYLGWEQPDSNKAEFWLSAKSIIELVEDYLAN